MRILYFILKIALNYALRLFYSKTALVNSPKGFYGRTIYVSNHAASFMDPLVVAAFRRPIVFFMTRSDVFRPIMKPIVWACHMFPIYREQDGEDTKGKNEEVFKKCSRILAGGRNLLIFGEGFTDDTFIRRLKPVKKGAARIGFMTLEAVKWKKKVYLAAVGCNYSHPNKMRSDLLISTSNKICLNDYKEEYLENPNKVILQLTKQIESMMKDQITHVEDKNLATFHENIMILTRKGMNPDASDRLIPLITRWEYSRNLAKWLNEQDLNATSDVQTLKDEIENYFIELRKRGLADTEVYWKLNNKSGSRWKEVLSLLVLFPLMLVGIIHCGLPYFFTKRFVERSFKRKVFWSSVKLMLGMLTIAIFNIPVLFLFYQWIYPNWWLSSFYFLTIGLTGLAAYSWFNIFKEYRNKGRVKKMQLSEIGNKRALILNKMEKMIPIK